MALFLADRGDLLSDAHHSAEKGGRSGMRDLGCGLSHLLCWLPLLGRLAFFFFLAGSKQMLYSDYTDYTCGCAMA